ncbi:uncharacterized protein PO1_contig-026-15 [Mycobacterium sp. PO1]|nr:uncharacterized protein PO1_contig-026-15 [Mycobacterium sp. PO1]GFM24347.1 uncharacterized protein PO2_contig-037-15 [Mycobacterium sp. PO2]
MVDSSFDFLSDAESEMLRAIVSRRKPAVYEHLRLGTAVSRADAEEIVNALGDELTNNLDDDWEPTEYGLAVSALLGRFNAARIARWPS